MIHPTINVRKVADLPFNAFLGKQRIGLYAQSQNAARQKAIEHFKPKRHQREYIMVIHAEGK